MSNSNNVPAPIEIQPISVDGDARNKIFVPIEGRDQEYQRDYEELGISFDSSDTEILETMRPILLEAFNKDIQSPRTGWVVKVHRAEDRQNLFLIPNSEAG